MINIKKNSLFVALALVMMALAMQGCSDDNKAGKVEQVGSQPTDVKIKTLDAPKDQSEQVYKLLLAEAYYYNQEDKLAAENFLSVAKTTQNPYIAERAVALAIQAEQFDAALEAALRWKTFDKKSTDLGQYLVLLYQEKGMVNEAAQELHVLIKLLNNEEKSGLAIAVALLDQTDNADNAYNILKTYAAQHDNSLDCAYYVALFAFRAKQYDEVLRVTRRFEKADKAELVQKASLLRVKAFTALNKTDEAINELNNLIQGSADIATRQSYARLMASMGKADKAVELLQQIYQTQSENTSLLLDMIAIRFDQEKYSEALPLIDDLEKKKGQQSNAHYYRGLASETLEQYAKALAEYNVIDADKRETLDVQVRITSSMEKLEGLDSAIKYLHKKQKTITDNTYLSQMYVLESDVYNQAKQFKKALEANRKAEKLEPKNVEILYSQALLHEDLGDIETSEKTLKAILEIDKKHTSALNALGYLLAVHTTRFDEALGYIKQANQLLPNDPAIIDSLGWVYFYMGELDKSEKYLRQAYKKLQDTEIAGHLIEVLVKKGKKDEAHILLKKMLKKNPDDEILQRVKRKLQLKS